ncbi:MAG TPA: GAF domain-containing protein, partial [Candidatus Angelobacter sp.]|nr:GAF domain-containing protein [Candidatus Angelobacter sp.]
MTDSRKSLSGNDRGKQLSDVLADLVRRLTDDKGQAQILCPIGNQLFIVASTRAGEVGEAVLIDDSVSGEVFKWQESKIIGDVREVRHYKNFLGGEMRSEIAVPLPSAWGVINVESPKKNAFTEEQIAVLKERA